MTDFARLLGDLNEAGVRYVVVGGIAVVRHGYVRATRDLDVVIRADDDTAGRLAPLMAAWHATRPDGSAEPRDRPSRSWPLHLATRYGEIDLLAEPAPPQDLEGLLARSEVRPIDGVGAPICSLEDLAVLKRACGRPQDLADLARLAEIHGRLPGG